MSFFGGFAKGFADGYNADIAAKKAAELERLKYQESVRYKAGIDKNVNDSANTINFGNLTLNDGNQISANIIANYTESDKILASDDNISRVNDFMNTPLSELYTLQTGLKSSDNRTFIEFLQNGSEQEKNQAMSVLNKIQPYVAQKTSFINNKNKEITRDQTLLYNYPIGKYNNPVLSLLNNDSATYNLLKNKNIKDILPTYGDEELDTVTNIAGEKVDPVKFADFLIGAVTRRSLRGDLQTGVNAVRGFSKEIKEELGMDVDSADPISIANAGYLISKFGTSFKQLSNNKENLNALLSQIINPSNSDKGFYLPDALDVQSAVSLNIKRTANRNIEGDYLKVVSFDQAIKSDKEEFGKTRDSYNNAMKSVERTKGILNNIGDTTVPLGAFQTMELYLRGLKDSKNQFNKVIQSLTGMGGVRLTEGGGGLLDGLFNTSSKNLESATKTMQELQQKYNMDDQQFYNSLALVAVGREGESGFKDKKDLANIKESNTAIVKYHSYLLAFEMAAAIQGGGDSRTISDKDVNLMQNAISARILTAGADFRSVITEIKNNMESVAQFHGLFYNAISKEDLSLYRAAKLMTGPQGIFNIGLAPKGEFNSGAEAMARKLIKDTNIPFDSLSSETNDSNITQTVEKDQEEIDKIARILNVEFTDANSNYQKKYGTIGNYGNAFSKAYNATLDENVMGNTQAEKTQRDIVNGLVADFKTTLRKGASVKNGLNMDLDNFLLLFNNSKGLQDKLRERLGE